MFPEKVEKELADRPYLRSANTAEGAFCEICRTPVATEYPKCFRCQKRSLLSKKGRFYLADSVGFIIYAMKNGVPRNDSTYRDLFDYKKSFGNDEWWTVSSLLAQSMRDDLPILEARDGAVDLVTRVPSTSATHPKALENAVTFALRAVGRESIYRGNLLESVPEVEKGSKRSMEEDLKRFRSTDTTSQGCAGKHVLIVEDTWVTGSSAQAAAHVLKNAGAKRVTILCVARLLDPEFNKQYGFPEKYSTLPKPSMECPVIWSGDAPCSEATGSSKISVKEVPEDPASEKAEDAQQAELVNPTAEYPVVMIRESPPNSSVGLLSQIKVPEGPVTVPSSARETLPGGELRSVKFKDEGVRKGIIGEQRTAGILSVFLNNSHSRILHSVSAGHLHGSLDERRDIDHVLFTTAGVFVINTKYRSSALTDVQNVTLSGWMKKVERDAQDIADVASVALTDSAVGVEAVYHPTIAIWSEPAFTVETKEESGAIIVHGENIPEYIRSLPDVIAPETCTAMFELVRLRLDRQ